MPETERFRKTNPSAFLNFLHAKYEAYTGAIRVRSRPYYAMVDPSDICQLRCPTCPTGIESEGRGRGDEADTTYRTDRSLLGADLFDALLEELGEHLFLMELHSWGEPLLNKQLPSFVRKARAKGIETHMHTNLSLPLSDERIEDLLCAGLDFLFASVDGFSQAAYERFRVGGNVELVKSNLERLAKTRDRLGLETHIIYKFLIFAWNEHEVPDAMRFAANLGIDFQPQDASVPDASWLPNRRRGEKPFLSEADVGVLDQQWAAAGSPRYWKKHERHAYWMPLDPGNKWIPTDGPQVDSFCGWHYGVAVIQPGGDVAPCCITPKASDRFGRVVPGRVGFEEIWNNDLYRKSRAAFAGEDAPDLAQADTVCTRCYFPDAFKQVFSHNDFKVVGQFVNLFRGTDSKLERAFELIAAGEGNAERRRFVAFFKENLMERFPEGSTSP